MRLWWYVEAARRWLTFVRQGTGSTVGEDCCCRRWWLEVEWDMMGDVVDVLRVE
jgi:hypothetical protein